MSYSNGVVTTNGSAVEQLQARLNEPRTAEALNQLLDNIELISFSVTALDGFVRRGEEIAEEVAASVAQVKETVPTLDPQVMELGPKLLQMLPQLVTLTTRVITVTSSPEFQKLLDLISDPKTLNNLTLLLKHAELLAFLVDALDGFLQRGDVLVDNVAASVTELVQTLTANGPQLAELAATVPVFTQQLPQLAENLPQVMATLPQLLEVATQLQPALASPEFKALMSSGVLNPKTLTVIGQAGDALVESYDEHRQAPQAIGLFSLLRALNNPDMQRTLGFAVKFADRFGKTLQ